MNEYFIVHSTIKGNNAFFVLFDEYLNGLEAFFYLAYEQNAQLDTESFTVCYAPVFPLIFKVSPPTCGDLTIAGECEVP